MSGDDWCTIESDPGVFTEMLSTLGCSAVELEELWSLDDDSLMRLGDGALGLIFLFQYVSPDSADASTPTKQPLSEDEIPENVFFAHQVITNACATQAILSVVFNAGLTTEELGPTLSDFYSFTSTFPPDLKGVAIGSSEEIRKCHNAFGRPDAFLNDEKLHVPTGNEEAYHFVAYVPAQGDGTLYELDGLQSGPVVVSNNNNSNDSSSNNDNSSPVPAWLVSARDAIQERMQAGGDNIKFNLMAVTRNQRTMLQAKLTTLSADSPEYHETLSLLETQNVKHEQWKKENQRRRHNYVPFCMQLLKEMAMLPNFTSHVTQARERYAEKRKKNRQV